MCRICIEFGKIERFKGFFNTNPRKEVYLLDQLKCTENSQTWKDQYIRLNLTGIDFDKTRKPIHNKLILKN